jgi:hypothetical protein
MKTWFITIGCITVLLITVFTVSVIKLGKAIEEKGLHTILVEVWEGSEEE